MGVPWHRARKKIVEDFQAALAGDFTAAMRNADGVHSRAARRLKERFLSSGTAMDCKKQRRNTSAVYFLIIASAHNSKPP
jgi:hypothetical protein